METAATSTALAQAIVCCPRTQGFHKAGQMGSHNSCHFPFLVCLTSSRAASFPVSLSGKKISESFLSSPSRPRLSAALGTGRSCWELRDPGTGLPHTAWPLPPAQGELPRLLPFTAALPPMNHPHCCCCCSRTTESQAAPHLGERLPVTMGVEAGRLSSSKGRRLTAQPWDRPTSASPFLHPWSELKGAGEGRTWELDHPAFRVKAPVFWGLSLRS